MTRQLNFNVGGDPRADVPVIQPDNPPGTPAITDGHFEGGTPPNRFVVMIPNESTGGAWVTYQKGKKRFRVILPPTDIQFSAEAGEYPQLPPEYNGDADKVALHYTDDAELPVLQIVGRFFRQRGNRFFLKGRTGFNLPARFRYEGHDAVEEVLGQSQELRYNAIRLWSAYNVPLIGRLIPREVEAFYDTVVVPLSHLCAQYGHYPYWTGLTGPYSVSLGGMPEIAAHDQAMQQALTQVPFALYDRRNEYSKDVNQVDASKLGPLFYNLASQGSGQQDEAPPLPLGRFYAYHPGSGEWQRKTGKQSFDYANDQGVQIPGVDDETTRCEPSGETSTTHAFNAGQCGALFVAGAFYHSAQAKIGMLWSGTEYNTAKAFSDGCDDVINQGLDVAQDGAYSRPEDPAYLRVYVKTLGARSITVKVEHG